MPKRIIAINDISCVGKCSLTVALPVISAAGVECSILPTSLLSTHTGGFTGYTFTPLTEDMRKITAHWKSLGLRADAVYSGYLGDPDQAEITADAMDAFGGLAIVDPVMADNGKLYPGFDMRTVEVMRKLVRKADLAMPNITEASFITEDPCDGSAPVPGEALEKIMKKLSALGAKKVVISGVEDGEGIGAATYDSYTGRVSYSFAPKYEGYYHGTGDVFGSVVASMTVLGASVEDAAAEAARFTSAVVKRTRDTVKDVKYGPAFEEELPSFVEVCRKLAK